ncbi:MAG TPA: hypothetical protein VFP53_04365, partial [Sphingomicrobium sp.]|nr:hypothetical protein [Sphingomicrobium sp.]
MQNLKYDSLVDHDPAHLRDFSLDHFYDLGYRSYGDKPILPLTGEESVTSHLDTGREIDVGSDGVITYGFFTGNHAVGTVNNPHSGEGFGYSPFSAEQKAAAVEAIQLWDDLIPQSFVNVGDISVKEWAHNDATIVLANTTTGPAQAWAYYPGGSNPSDRGYSDVWTATPSGNPSNAEFKYG